MLQQSKLLEANPQLGLLDGLFRDKNQIFRDSNLSNEQQIAVSNAFEQAEDRSLFSFELENLANTDQLRSELSPAPYQYLSSLQLEQVEYALDLSQDFGGVSHFISCAATAVDSIKLDSDRARLSTLRCRDRGNICHISEDLDKLEFPAQHYQLIVIGAIESLNVNAEQLPQLLHKLQAALAPNGLLIITAKNSNRIAKWLNPNNQSVYYPVDPQTQQAKRQQNTIPYRELYDAEDQQSLLELVGKLNQANFGETRSYCTFSSEENCDNLFSEDYITSHTNALNHFYRMGAVSNAQVNEYLVFKAIRESQQRAFDLASRYVVFCGANADTIRQFIDLDFAHYPGTSRQPQWRTVTERKRGSVAVTKTPRFDNHDFDSQSEQAVSVSQNLAEQTFYKGDSLIGDWLQAVLNNDTEQFKHLIRDYHEWLAEQQQQPNFNQIGYDLLPFNIVVHPRSKVFQVIDPEWQVSGTELSADFVLFRALFWFAFENRAVLANYLSVAELSTIGQFVVHHHPNIGQVNELGNFVELEEIIQQQIGKSFRANSIATSLHQSLISSDASTSSTECQLCWGNEDNVFNEASAVTLSWKLQHDSQTLIFDKLSFDNDKPVLRIDPLASLGIFKISELKFKSKTGDELLTLNAKQVVEQAKLHNIKPDAEKLIAVNDDPHLTLNISDLIGNADKELAQCEITLELLKDAHYEDTLRLLTDAVELQDQTLTRQANRLDQYRAELEYQERRLNEVISHRTDLWDMIQKLEQQKEELNHKLVHLNDQLVAQLGRNEEMENFLMMRPSTRGKRFVSRTLNRIQGKPVVAADQPEADDDQPLLDQYGLPAHGELIGQNVEDYQLWVQQNDLTPEQIEQAKAEIETFKHKPVFSILVPIYNTDLEYLLPMIRSVQAQIYPHWQLCLVDDCSPNDYLKSILEYEAQQDSRISLQLNDHNQGISLTTNDALAMATGDFIGLLDHDDEISVDALFHNAKAINQNDDVDLLYSDEDKMDMQGNRLEPYFKPDFSPDLLHTNNYICHFTVIRKTVADEIGGFREGLDGSQDHDIILRAASKARNIVHIPRILYHWRKIPGSTAVVYDSKSYAWEAGRKAVENTLLQNESDVRVEFGSLKGTYRVFREIKGNPLISIVIPFKDKPELLHTCLNSILQRSTYENFEVVGVSNNSELDETFEAMKHFSDLDSRIRFVEKNVPFNFSEVCNFGVEHANGEYIVLLNNDIEIISADWIERLLEHAQRPEVGAVGGKLLYPDGRIQHAGVVAGMVGAAGHPHKFFPDNHIGYHGRLHMVYNVSAVTGAMLMVSKQKFIDAGGLDQDHLAVAYNDIDFCLSLIDQGYYNVFTPHCKATHHESISRGYEDTPEKLERLKREQSFFLEKWQNFLANGDPYYNPNLSLKNERFSLNYKD